MEKLVRRPGGRREGEGVGREEELEEESSGRLGVWPGRALSSAKCV